MPAQIYGLPPGRIAAIVATSAVVSTVLLVAPAIAGQLATQLNLGPAQIGTMFSAELAAMSLATVPSWWWLPRFDWRRAALIGALVFLAANIASVFATTFGSLIVLRFISALGGGSVMVVALASAASSPERDRVYGLWVCGQLVLGAVGLWILPGLFAAYGLAALYGGLVVLILLCLPLIAFFPPSAPPKAAAATGGARQTRRTILAILAVLTFYIGLSGVWAFVGTIATNAGLDAATSGIILAVATLLGIIGSLTATFTGSRAPRNLSLLLGYGGMILSVAAFYGLPGVARFAFAACLFKFVWTYVLPFILASVAELDHDGRLMSTVNLVIGGGIAIGPVVAGNLLERNAGNTTILLTTALAFLAFSVAAILISRAGLAVARTPEVTA